ncbi:F-box/FBD/LRR-repeat protein At1g13570-like [Cornus florida]|uniref:F-box/FBD/LRR-repeat protein At1g13570-like n=1 Tax=Cornus florida TaxID=4283 RepID=UPI00289B4C5B|nr:F-box/FBD/LRR-repeat protein At1g13570-like [Cornus florida]
MDQTVTSSCKAANAAEDIISDLPRELIDRILGCMPIRDVARTSVLCRKWRCIWATHPRLILDGQFCQETIENKPFIPQNFVNVINKIFRLHSGPILEFYLKIPFSIGTDQNADIDHWILILSRNGIKKLTFFCVSPLAYKLPPSIFSCSQLTGLRLWNCILKPPHGTDVLGTLFSSAPLLEDLIISECVGIEHFNIHAPALKYLMLMGSREFKSISFKNSPNITMLTILLNAKVDNPEWGKTTNLIELVASLPRIKVLMLDKFVLKVLAAGTVSKRSPAIKHLWYLHLADINFDDLDQISCIMCLLESSINLKQLHITADEGTGKVMQPFFNFYKESDWIDLKLRIVRLILDKSCSTAEFLFIEFLLAHCLILEKMLIEIDANEGCSISKKLMQLPRASQRAEVILVQL